jgi:hypothetical protein
MSRLVEPRPKQYKLASAAAPGAEPPPPPKDTLRDYAERVAKYVPAEVLAFYGAAVNVVGTVPDAEKVRRLWYYGVALVIFWIGAPLWLGRFTDNLSCRRTNQVMGFSAFAVWAYAYPAGWFKDMGWHDPVAAGLALIVFTFASAFVTPK